jgi:hypothetical protein
MILGVLFIALILTYVLVTYYQRQVQEERASTTLSTRTDPVSNYVTQCLKITSMDAITEMGEHGGYTDLDRNGFSVSTDSTNTDAVIFAPTGSSTAASSLFAIPYYWQMKSPSGCGDGCQFTFGIPYPYKDYGIASIEDELDKYINDHLEKCINNFEDFKAQGYSIEERDIPQVDSRINEETMSFTLKWPLRVHHTNNTYETDIFYVDQDIDFMQTYALAYEVTMLQANYRYLERMGLNLIADYALTADSELPPMADSSFDFGSPGKIWVKTDAKNKVQDILAKYTHALRAYGTNNYVDIADEPVAKKLMDNQMRIILNYTYDREIYFNYIPGWWPIYFDLNCDGEICKPESFSNTLFILIGTQKYRFYYTVSYPVMVKIYDPYAFNGKGFNYYFFLESNIRYNDILYPNATGNNVVVGGSSMLCNENQRNSGNYSINITDALNGTGVKDVSLYFTCGTESCLIDQLDNGNYYGSLPLCVGGLISGIKDGYMQQSYYVFPKIGKGKEINISLEPLRTRSLEIRKQVFTPIVKENDDSTVTVNWTLSGEASLKQNQEITVILTKNRLDGEKEYLQVATIDSDNPKGNVSLVPGTYEVQAYMQDKNTIIIPNETRTIKIIGDLWNKKYDMPGLLFNESTPYSLGGLTGNFTITDEIDNSDTLVLKVVSFELGDVPEAQRKIEMINVIGEVGNYSRDYRTILGFDYR